jgi:hypothetical protein
MPVLTKTVTQYLANLDLTSPDAVAVFQTLCAKLEAHRKEHGGNTPFDIFPYTTGIGVSSATREVAVVIYSREKEFVGHALLLRPNDHQGWDGMYHIPGTTLTRFDSKEGQLDRLSKKLFGVSGKLSETNTWAQEGRFGVVDDPIYDEPERFTHCQSVVHLLKLFGDEATSLVEGWKLFTDPRDPQICAHQWPVLEKIELLRRK